jgi:hypothetical protein
MPKFHPKHPLRHISLDVFFLKFKIALKKASFPFLYFLQRTKGQRCFEVFFYFLPLNIPIACCEELHFPKQGAKLDKILYLSILTSKRIVQW